MPSDIDPSIKLFVQESQQALDKEFNAQLDKLEQQLDKREERLKRDLKRSGLKDTSLVVLFSLLCGLGVYSALKQHFDTDITKKIQEYSLTELQTRAQLAAEAAEKSAAIAKQEVSNIRGEDSQAIRNIHLFSVDKYVEVVHKKCGEQTIDLATATPSLSEAARGVLLKVIIASPSGSGSLICADNKGNYSTLVHYLQNGFTNYANSYAGGTVICPLLEGQRKIKFKTASNKAPIDPAIEAYVSVIGWYD